eukprot:Protomagalhaensia_wolfi_Nauph_80__6077@NODE_856_length_1944_cov_971_013123_g644_i0_p2_GENE_NODE_856_length_1944_cov_971_013123_g644_i0NODE_856_length_1944_cov_971_013123_g644_i0_p2_ORF_typecomplete_len147_score21_70Ribosomal_L16/PF00252_18/9_5e16_NODE_856_length_1944_cov_971_013123_g644_i0381821
MSLESTRCFHVPEPIGKTTPSLPSLHSNMNRLQTGMRGAYGKPNGLVARVNIGQILMSIRTREDRINHAVAALTRAKYKFAGRQRVFTSVKWGFTPYDKETYKELQSQGLVVSDGATCKTIRTKGPLSRIFPGAARLTMSNVDNTF